MGAAMRLQTNLQQDSSLLNWYPKIEGKIPTPKTEIYPITPEEFWKMVGLLDGDEEGMAEYERLKNEIEARTELTYPLFLRSDQGSAKHNYLETCYVPEKDCLLQHLVGLIEWHLCRDLFPQAIVLRELLDLEAPFKAFDGLPIAKERRWFVDEEKIMCFHPYWPEDAIQFYEPTKPLPGWPVFLGAINIMDDEEVRQLAYYAEIFRKAVPGFYSVDFAQDRQGKWWLIDAARGELSYHPPHDGGEKSDYLRKEDPGGQDRATTGDVLR